MSWLLFVIYDDRCFVLIFQQEKNAEENKHIYQNYADCYENHSVFNKKRRILTVKCKEFILIF